jgi:uncharacterized membrane protein YfcA
LLLEIPPLLAVGLAAGGVGAVLGVGGGILNVPILHLMCGLPFERAVATSVYVIGITAAAAAAVYLARGDVQVTVAGATMLGTLAGAGSAAAIRDRFNQRAVKMGFAVLLLVVAIRMVARGVS